MRQLYAIQFWLEAPRPTSRAIIAWPQRDNPRRILWPAHPDKTWLDVKVGDTIVGKRRGHTERVIAVEIFRAFPAEQIGATINCGRDWLDADRVLSRHTEQ